MAGRVLSAAKTGGALTTSSISTRPVEVFVQLGIVVGVSFPAPPCCHPPRGKKRDVLSTIQARPLFSVEQLAKIFGGGFGRTIDILRNGNDLLSHPGPAGGARRRNKSIAKDARGAGVDKGTDACRHGFFQQVSNVPVDVRVDENLVGDEWRT